MTNADMPAMPQSFSIGAEDCGTAQTHLNDGDQYTGLTKREMFAMHAMQGLLANSTEWLSVRDGCAIEAVAMADALLAELDKEGE